MILVRYSKLGLFVWLMFLVSCGQKTIEDQYSLEYLDAKTGKPLVYPAGVDKPELSLEYEIPEPPKKAAAEKYDVEQVLKPPRIVPLPKEEESEKEEPKEKN